MSAFVAWFKQVFFPKRCMLCDRILADRELDMCPECRLTEMVILNNAWKIPHVKNWIPLWRYAGYVRDSLIRYKFHHRRCYGPIYGRELAQKLTNQKVSFDLLTWVPVSWQRKNKRGYDQVQLLAEEVGKNMGVKPVRLLKKCRHNQKQATLITKKERTENVKGVYTVVDPDLVKGKHILLLDDIITTGTTVSEAAKMLKAAGAKTVVVSCIAAASGNMK